MLKPDLVIRELWPEETRTKRSADVAAEMNRLRHALEAYYNGEGMADPITISLLNRSVTAAVDGAQEKYWIVAKPRGGIEDHPPGPQLKLPRGVKIMGAIAAFAASLGIAAYISIRVLAVHRVSGLRIWRGKAIPASCFLICPPQTHNPTRRCLSAIPIWARRNGVGRPGEICRKPRSDLNRVGGRRRSRLLPLEY